jgi:hypothetical protein
LIHQDIDGITGEVSGFGKVGTVNGSTAFTCSTCELTFTFGGYTPLTPNAVPSIAGGVINYANGWINFYYDSSAEAVNSNINTMTQTTASDGVLWLGTVGHNRTAGPGAGVSFQGIVELAAFTNAVTSLTGKSGLLDVAAGAAGGNTGFAFNTNTSEDGADFNFTTGFTTLLGPIIEDEPNARLLSANGSGNFYGDSLVVSEPETLTLFGLGLLGLAAARRRKQA